jgi:hypothetical protein
MEIPVGKFYDANRWDFWRFWLHFDSLEKAYYHSGAALVDIDDKYAPECPAYPSDILNVNLADRAAFDMKYLHLISEACRIAGLPTLTISRLNPETTLVATAGKMTFCLMPLKLNDEERGRLRKLEI